MCRGRQMRKALVPTKLPGTTNGNDLNCPGGEKADHRKKEKVKRESENGERSACKVTMKKPSHIVGGYFS